jgi:hypothetical protein
MHTLLVLAGDPPDTASAWAAIARLGRWVDIVHTIQINDRGGNGDLGWRAPAIQGAFRPSAARAFGRLRRRHRAVEPPGRP